MKLTIQKSTLNEALQHVSKAINSKVTMPILSGIKLEATNDGLTLTASDTDITIQCLIPDVEVSQSGSIVLPAKFLVEIVRKLPKETVEISVSNLQASIKSGKMELELVGLDPDEFPSLPSLSAEGTFSLKGSVLKSLIKKSSFAVSTNENVPALQGESWNLAEGVLKVIATDRHRLVSVWLKADQADGVVITNLTVPGKKLDELSKIIPDNKDVLISASDNQILFKVDNLLFYSRLLDGNYPDTSKIIQQTFKSEINVNTSEFTEAMERAYLLSKEEKTNVVKLRFIDTSSIELSSTSGETSKVREQVEISNFVGEEMMISFNSKYMLDALKAIDTEQIHIGFSGLMSPIIIKPVGKDESLHLILPYRTQS